MKLYIYVLSTTLGEPRYTDFVQLYFICIDSSRVFFKEIRQLGQDHKGVSSWPELLTPWKPQALKNLNWKLHKKSMQRALFSELNLSDK